MSISGPLPRDQLQPGMLVRWYSSSRRFFPVDATVVAVHRNLVTIRVQHHTRGVVDRRVRPSSLYAHPAHPAQPERNQ